MIQPNEPVIAALRQDIIEIRQSVEELRKSLDSLNSSIQTAFEGMAKGTGMTLRFLDARVDDMEKRVEALEMGSLGLSVAIVE